MNQTRNERMRLIVGGALCATACVALLGSGLAHAADPMTSATGGNLDSADRKFVENATIGGMAEVELGKLAQTKGASPAVKQFGEHMVADHTKASAELSKIATAKGVTPPGTMDKSHKSDAEDLAKKSGADFDKAYAKAMVADHKKTVSDFESEAKSGKDADLKAFAGKTLPTLQEHLKAAQALEDTVKKSN